MAPAFADQRAATRVDHRAEGIAETRRQRGDAPVSIIAEQPPRAAGLHQVVAPLGIRPGGGAIGNQQAAIRGGGQGVDRHEGFAVGAVQDTATDGHGIAEADGEFAARGEGERGHRAIETRRDGEFAVVREFQHLAAAGHVQHVRRVERDILQTLALGQDRRALDHVVRLQGAIQDRHRKAGAAPEDRGDQRGNSIKHYSARSIRIQGRHPRA